MGSSKAAVAGAISPVHEPSMNQQDPDDAARLKAMDHVIHSAKMASQKEQMMTLMEGVRLYPKAILWSMLISTCIVMEGYDICLINNFCLYPFLFYWYHFSTFPRVSTTVWPYCTYLSADDTVASRRLSAV